MNAKNERLVFILLALGLFLFVYAAGSSKPESGLAVVQSR